MNSDLQTLLYTTVCTEPVMLCHNHSINHTIEKKLINQVLDLNIIHNFTQILLTLGTLALGTLDAL